MSHAGQQLYRFALYGRSGSGKSCVLGTLALGAVGHPGGLTVQRMPVTVSRPDDEEVSAQPEESEAAGLHKGREWIDKVVQALEQHDVPPPNQATFEGAPPSVDFKIGSPDRGEFLVRTIDYAGELINPKEEHVSESIANKLKACLKEFDGFLILAEIPRDEDAVLASASEIRLLREAFASLREQQETAPVAVLLTKWDRYSEIEFDDPSTERGRLQEYLESHSDHSSLVDAIRNAVTEHSEPPDSLNEASVEDSLTGLPAGNCRIFPGSSFGGSVRQDGKDLPLPDGQRPYGLLDPFVWLAGRRDALDAARLQQEFGESGLAGDCWPWRFWRHLKIKRKSAALLDRMPRDSSAARQVRQVRRGAFNRFSTCFLIWLVVAAGVGEAVYETTRNYQFANRVAIVDNPRATEGELLTARQWFDGYRRYPWNGFFTPSPKDAVRQMDDIDDKLEEIYWEPFRTAETLEAKAEAGERYTKKLPNGRHKAEATAIVEEWKQTQEKEENEDWLAAREQRADAAIGNENVQEMNQIVNDLDDLPHPKIASRGIFQRRRDLRDRLSEVIATVKAQEDWSSFVTTYNTALSEGNLDIASNLLAKRKPRDDQWRALVEGFPETVYESLQSLVDTRLQDRLYEDARSAFQAATAALTKLENTLRPTAVELADGMLVGQQKLQTIGQRIDSREDKYLYERVRTSEDQDSCTHYLDDAPVKSMENAVDRYHVYLNELDQPLDITIACRIFWDKAYDDTEDDHVLTVRIDDKVFLKKKSLTSTPNELSGEVGRIDLKDKTLRTALEIRADIIEEDSFLKFADDDAGKGKATFRLEDLQRDKTIKLRPSDGSGFANELRLKIVAGLPKKPELPEWTGP